MITNLYNKGYSIEKIAELTNQKEKNVRLKLYRNKVKVENDKYSRLNRHAQHKGYKFLSEIASKHGLDALRGFVRDFNQKIN